MLIRCHAIICAVRAHAEHGAIVRAMTADHGLIAGYVRGGRSTRLRPILGAGNIIAAEFRARTEDQLASLTAELLVSRAGLHGEPLAAAALDWTTALLAATLPEGQAYPRIHSALDAMLMALEAAHSARGWAGGLAAFERLALSELGYGSDQPDAANVLDTLRVNRKRLADDVLAGRRGDVMAARDRLIDRLERALGDGEAVDGGRAIAPKRIA
jgi:DNA repair protein RecO (recombination protein O)